MIHGGRGKARRRRHQGQMHQTSGSSALLVVRMFSSPLPCCSYTGTGHSCAMCGLLVHGVSLEAIQGMLGPSNPLNSIQCNRMSPLRTIKLPACSSFFVCVHSSVPYEMKFSFYVLASVMMHWVLELSNEF